MKQLVYHYGWQELGCRIKIRCFNITPSLKSSLQFLRRTPWARTKVEALYLEHLKRGARPAEKPARRPDIENRDCVAGCPPSNRV